MIINNNTNLKNFFLFSLQSGGYKLDKEKNGQAMCPYDPQHNSTAVYVGKFLLL